MFPLYANNCFVIIIYKISLCLDFRDYNLCELGRDEMKPLAYDLTMEEWEAVGS